MTLVLVALGALLVGVGVTVAVARYFFLLGWEKARDDRALDPGLVVGLVSSVSRAVGEVSGRHHKPQASDGPAPDVDGPVWPSGDGPTQVLEPVRDEVKA